MQDSGSWTAGSSNLKFKLVDETGYFELPILFSKKLDVSYSSVIKKVKKMTSFEKHIFDDGETVCTKDRLLETLFILLLLVLPFSPIFFSHVGKFH